MPSSIHIPISCGVFFSLLQSLKTLRNDKEDDNKDDQDHIANTIWLNIKILVILLKWVMSGKSQEA